jgi:hypothetical protein
MQNLAYRHLASPGKISVSQFRSLIEQTAKKKLPEAEYEKIVRRLNCTKTNEDLARECVRILEKLQD